MARERERIFYGLHCTVCRSTFGGWDRDPQRLEVELDLLCRYCGGSRIQHPERAE